MRRPTGLSFWILALSILVLILSAQLPSAGVGPLGIFILVLLMAYLKSGRNIWLPILLHGWVDTFGLYYIYAGIDQQLLNV